MAHVSRRREKDEATRGIMIVLFATPIVLALAYLAYALFYIGGQSDLDRCQDLIGQYGITFDCEKVGEVTR